MNIYSNNKIIALSFRDYMKQMLITKTKSRIEKWDRTDIVSQDEIMINGKKYLGVNECLKRLEKRIIGRLKKEIAKFS